MRDLSSSPVPFPDNDDDDTDPSRHGNVRAQRLIQSIKRTKKASGGALFWEGWMMHTTEKDPLTEKKYYWRVDASYVQQSGLHRSPLTLFSFRFLTMFQNETTNKFSREIQLELVTLHLNVDDDRSHHFEIRTEPNIFLCGCKRTRNRVGLRRKERRATFECLALDM